MSGAAAAQVAARSRLAAAAHHDHVVDLEVVLHGQQGEFLAGVAVAAHGQTSAHLVLQAVLVLAGAVAQQALGAVHELLELGGDAAEVYRGSQDQAVALLQLGIDLVHPVPEEGAGVDAAVLHAGLPAAGEAALAAVDVVVPEIDGLRGDVAHALGGFQSVAQHPVGVGVLAGTAGDAKDLFHAVPFLSQSFLSRRGAGYTPGYAGRPPGCSRRSWRSRCAGSPRPSCRRRCRRWS